MVLCGVVLYCVVLRGVVLCVLVDVCWSKCCSVQGNALQENGHFKNHVAAGTQNCFNFFSGNVSSHFWKTK